MKNIIDTEDQNVEKTKKRHWIVYMYTTPSGKRYIGKTNRTLKQRQAGYDWRGYERCTVFWKAIQKYGVENIKTDILFEGDIDDDYAARLEQMYILLFKTNCNRFENPKYGYNLTDGGEGLNGWHPVGEDLERRRAQLAAFREKKKGKPLTQKELDHLAYARSLIVPKPLSEETKRKLSIANSLENITEETRKRKSLGHSKWVKVTLKDTGKELIFPRALDAAKHFGVRESAISRWISGKRIPRNGHKFENYIPTETERKRRYNEVMNNPITYIVCNSPTSSNTA